MKSAMPDPSFIAKAFDYFPPVFERPSYFLTSIPINISMPENPWVSWIPLGILRVRISKSH